MLIAAMNAAGSRMMMRANPPQPVKLPACASAYMPSVTGIEISAKAAQT